MPDIDISRILPGWGVTRLIGRGSYGTVYEIERDVFGHKEKAALKVISIPQSEGEIRELVSDGYDEESIRTRYDGYMQNIVREYSLMAEMKGCTNIVYCDDVKYSRHEDGLGWDILIKMEMLTALPAVLGKTITEEQAVRIGTDIANALAYCERHHVVHRDVKPQNIFVSEDGTYKLGDFGVAKTIEQTTGGTRTGTFNYMAPEVYMNQPYGSKADIYTLGLVLYWLLNERRLPFLPLPPAVPSASDEEKARQRRYQGETLPPPAHGSAKLKMIVLKACAHDPKDRYQSAEALLNALQALNGRPEPVKPVPASPVTERPDGNDLTAGFREKPAAEEATVGAFSRPKPPENTSSEKPKRKPWIPVVAALLVVAMLAGIAIPIIRGAGKNKAPAKTEQTVSSAVTGTKKETSVSTTAKPESAAENSAAEAEPAASVPIRVGLVTDIAGINDGSYNQWAWEGLRALASENRYIDADYLESRMDSDYSSNINTFVDEGYDLIICIGFMLSDALREAALANPDQKFAIVDDDLNTDLPNVACLMFSPEQSAFLAGLVAGSYTKTGIVGFVQGMETGYLNRFRAGFKAGVLMVKPDASILYVNANNFGDMSAGAAIANDMIDQGADVIYHAAGATGIGAIQACDERGVWAIGVDTNQSVLAPEHVLTSSLFRVDVACRTIAEEVKNGTFTGGVHTFDASHNGIGIVDSEHLSQAVLALVGSAMEDMAAGNIRVPTDPDEVG